MIDGLLALLWTQEAADWAQAFGSVFAIFATYRLSTRSRRIELADRAIAARSDGRALALAIFPAIQQWMNEVAAVRRQTATSAPTFGAADLRRILPPDDVRAAATRLFRVPSVGHQLEAAYFLSLRLYQAVEERLNGFEGDRGFDADVIGTFRSDVVSIEQHLRRAREGIDREFSYTA
jgi:hypothetical protein